jgi:hypothetical protein
MEHEFHVRKLKGLLTRPLPARSYRKQANSKGDLMQKLMLVLALVVAIVTVTASTAAARGGDRGVVRAGPCTGSSTSKLKVKLEDGRVEAEFEVDENRTGRRWRVVIARNGRAVFTGVRRTVAPSGSFSVRRLIGGRGRFAATARELGTGEVCRASATI